VPLAVKSKGLEGGVTRIIWSNYKYQHAIRATCIFKYIPP
jgi:hypothetical protein